jgi:hypothetical protein
MQFFCEKVASKTKKKIKLPNNFTFIIKVLFFNFKFKITFMAKKAGQNGTVGESKFVVNFP